MDYSLAEIVARLGGELVGDGSQKISRLASLQHAKAGEISFLSNPKYAAQLQHTNASAVIVDVAHKNSTPLSKIVTDNPYAYFAKLSALMNPPQELVIGIANTAVIHDSAVIPSTCSISEHCTVGKNVVLGEHVVLAAGVVIGDGVTIGEGSRLAPNVVVYQQCVIGKFCNIAAGVVIGADGFGYAEDKGVWVKIPQVGRVIIEDNVDIGANTTIDRGALDDTVIEAGVKLDNLIQIGHNCRIGAHTVIAGCVGIAGSATIGKHCKIGGAAMILGHLQVADGVTITPGSMITRSLNKVATYTALMPFQTHDDWLKTAAQIRHLDELSERVKQLEKILSKLDSASLNK